MINEVIIYKNVLKFINSLHYSDKLKEKLKSLKEFPKSTLNIKSMKGSWKGYYRLIIEKIRFLFRINGNIIIIEEANFKGKVYK